MTYRCLSLQLLNETAWTNKTPGTREYQFGFAYDPNGNRILEHLNGEPTKYVYGDNNEMLEAGSAVFTYDHFGNTKTKTVSTNVTTYHYDFESHLRKIEFPSGPDDLHEYDGNGRRMRSKLAGASLWNNFVYDPLTGDLIAEYTEDAGDYTVHALNTYGIGLISTVRNEVKRYFHYDGLGSTWAMTDYDEVIKENLAWSGFGQLAGLPPIWEEPIPYGFVGQWGYYDDGVLGSQSRLLLLGSRFYDPTFGRFLTQDSIPSTNLYSYVSGSPAMLVDPTGRQATFDACLAALCAGKNVLLMLEDALGGVGATGAIDLLKSIFGELLQRILERVNIDYDNAKRCYEDARRERPNALTGRWIREFCTAWVGRKPNIGTCCHLHPGPANRDRCRRCCDTIGLGSGAAIRKCKERCDLDCLSTTPNLGEE